MARDLAGGPEKIHKVIISGTGRTGTTFLVCLLTRLGLDTGFDNPEETVDALSNAGLEFQLQDCASPYIVKSPWLCDSLDRLMRTGHYVIDHAFIPVRDLRDAAASRIAVSRRAGRQSPNGSVVLNRTPGGLWHTTDPARQEDVLARQFYKLIHAMAVHDIAHTFMDFPRFVRDAQYLYRKLSPILADMDFRQFEQAFEATSRPELVHDFSAS